MKFLSIVFFILLIITSLTWQLACNAQPETDSSKKQGKTDLIQVKPKWRVGDQWIVQTETQTLQERNSLNVSQKSVPVSWLFHVSKIEKIAGAPAFRVEITSQSKEESEHPQTTLWIDQQKGSIRQIQTQIPVQGGFRTITESYSSQSDQPTPVIGPLTALPLDLPLFQQGTKSTGSFQYQSFAGPAGTKAVGEVGFTNSVEQQFEQTKPAEVKKALGDSFVKSLESNSTLSIQLKGDFRQVSQIWQKDVPWPIYSDNGSTKTKLIKFTPAK